MVSQVRREKRRAPAAHVRQAQAARIFRGRGVFHRHSRCGFPGDRKLGGDKNMGDTSNPNPTTTAAAPATGSTAPPVPPAAAPATGSTAPPVPPARSHKQECGDVGATGAHGDLGSNKA